MDPKKPRNILEEIKKRGTFQVKPEEENIVQSFDVASADQVTSALEQRRKILEQQGTQVETETESQDTALFSGKSKQEVLQQAFREGVTEASALKQIGEIYELVMGEEEDVVLEGNKAWAYADELINLNPEASKEELSVELRRKTKLDVSDIDVILEEAGYISKKDTPSLTEDNLKSVAIALVKKNAGFSADSKEGLTKAKEQIEGGTIKVNDKDVSLSKSQINRIKELMDEEYPEGRTFLQKLLPFGK